MNNTQMPFNILIHGLCALWGRDDDGLKIYIPEVKIEQHRHVYLIGSWRTETELPPGEHRVLGLSDRGSMPPLDDSVVAVISREANVTLPNKPYITLVLPFPDEIRGVRKTQAENPKLDFFSGDTIKRDLMKQPTYRHDVWLLRYRAANPSGVKVTGVEWPHTNLHVFAEPEHDPTPGGMTEAFEKLVKQFSGIDLKRNDVKLKYVSEPLPAGVSSEELKSLSERGMEHKAADRPCCRGFAIP